MLSLSKCDNPDSYRDRMTPSTIPQFLIRFIEFTCRQAGKQKNEPEEIKKHFQV
jgi:hypothetical protein